MKLRTALPLSVAAFSLAVLPPAFAQSPSGSQMDQSNMSQSNMNQSNMNQSQQGSWNNQSNQGNSSWNNGHLRGRQEAMNMVPARAYLDRTLNADQMHPGARFRATLAHKVQLRNGPELPSGTILIGRISTDDMNEAGTSKLALRFTEAKLKDGQTVPIKATIVGVAGPETTNSDDYPVSPGDQEGNNWTHKTLAVDQINVLPGVDLHSKIASRNSGVFVSNTRHEMKLRSDSELELAIAQQQHPMNNMNNDNTTSSMNGNNSMNGNDNTNGNNTMNHTSGNGVQ